MSLLEAVIDILIEEKTLPRKYRDHQLKGNCKIPPKDRRNLVTHIGSKNILGHKLGTNNIFSLFYFVLTLFQNMQRSISPKNTE